MPAAFRANFSTFRFATALLFGSLGAIGAGEAQEIDLPPGYVGSASCAGCHSAEFQAWQTSDHRLAMQVAGEETVLGDFQDAEFVYNGQTSRFSRVGDRFHVLTEGPDGQIGEFEVLYTFGHYPLQQYLVSFPDGRLQALGLAWDSRPREEGGQRWFHLYPDQAVDFEDFLHWTHFTQNWNSNCAECHSTAVRKSYDVATDRYATTFSEISVGCEACHGPGLDHLQWAAAPDPAIANAGFDWQLASRISWARSPDEPIATPQGPPIPTEQGICAGCHSLRTQLADTVSPDYFDYFDLQPVTEPNYHIDGQIREEVFVYGSFLQSRMQVAGVTCANCHEPHSTELIAEGNALCAQCHDPQVFDSTQHHFHPAGAPGTQCVDCHMPATLFMQVDARRDHRFGIPRPDLAAALQTPDACSSCHIDDLAREDLVEAFVNWYPEQTQARSPGELFAAARDGAPQSIAPLLLALSGDELTPILRATALELLASSTDPNAQRLVARDLNADHPLVRSAALSAIESLDPDTRASIATARLGDASRSVRHAAVRVLADTSAAGSPTFQSALAEFLAAVDRNADNPAVLLEAADVHLKLGQWVSAEQLMQRARALAPAWPVPDLALADLYRATDRDGAAGALLEQAVQRNPDFAAAHYALGLQQVRTGHDEDALRSLQTARTLDPGNARYLYVLAVARFEAGEAATALDLLAAGIEQFPYDRTLRYALASYQASGGFVDEARAGLEQLLQIWPDDAPANALYRQLADQP